MADLRNLKKHEVFLTLKRDLAMVFFFSFFFLSVYAIFALREFILTTLLLFFSFFLFFLFFFFFFKAIQTTNIAEEWVDDAHKQMKDEEGRRITAVEAFTVAE